MTVFESYLGRVNFIILFILLKNCPDKSVSGKFAYTNLHFSIEKVFEKKNYSGKISTT